MIGLVELNVADLGRALAFYEGLLGLRVHARGPRSADLGAERAFLRLHATPDASPRAPRQAGLFHVAFLVPSRADLGRAIRHLIEQRWPLQGASDHRVSEALYLADAEGNGLEIYADRPRSAWPRRGETIEMATAPMDVRAVLAAAGDAPWAGAPEGTRVGHVHLEVSDVRASERFYAERVGLDVQSRYGESASFLAAEGYHHHVAVNAWGTRSGAPADPDALGLRRFEILLAPMAYETARDRLGGDDAADPSGQRLTIGRADAPR